MTNKMYKKEKIIDFPDYQVDTNGIIYSKKDKPLKYSINHKGYAIVNFYVDHKRTGHSVHQLVAKQFIYNDDPIKKFLVNHIDGNKLNNNISNLEWVTPAENSQHAIKVLNKNFGKNHWHAMKIIGINQKTFQIDFKFDSLSDAARYIVSKRQSKFEYVKHSLWRVLNKQRKTYLNYIWLYETDYNNFIDKIKSKYCQNC